MITPAQMATVISRRQYDSSAVGEVVLLNEILTTLSLSDPLRPRIVSLFEEETEGNWALDYAQVLAEARRRMI
jgi:hypothetical protein